MRNYIMIFSILICLLFLASCEDKITTKAVRAPTTCEETQVPQGKVVCTSNSTLENPTCTLTIFGFPKVQYKAISYNAMYGDKLLGKLIDGGSVKYLYEREMTLITIMPYIEKSKLLCENQSYYIRANMFKMQIANSTK